LLARAEDVLDADADHGGQRENLDLEADGALSAGQGPARQGRRRHADAAGRPDVDLGRSRLLRGRAGRGIVDAVAVAIGAHAIISTMTGAVRRLARVGAVAILMVSACGGGSGTTSTGGGGGER